jgi:aspartyl-tRNA(Asn)/glutamyl-tRNA(Gln) amidotransferase subunit A
MVAHASSFDTIGILAKTIYDCAAVLEIIAGPDAHDSTTSQRPVDRYTTQLDFTKKTRVAYLKEAIDYTGLQPEIRSHTWDTIETLKAQGHHVEGITFPLWEYILPTYYVLTAAEASSNLARFDGVRYGYRDPEVQKVTESYTQTRTQGFGKEVQRRILLGNFVLMSSHYDDDFLQAQKVRRRITEELKAILSSYDFILLPTTPHTAFDLDCNTHDPLSMYWADIYTTLAAIAGVPAISIPIGHDNEGLPIGLQLIGNSFQEASLLGFSNHILQTQK